MKTYDIYTTFDDPIPYKKLLFHPVSIRKSFIFSAVSEILLLEKNADKNLSPEEKIKRISMGYLDFLYSLATEENQYILRLKVLLSLCLKMDEKKDNTRMGYDKDNKAVFEINGDIYNGADFEEMRNIISEQNMLELPDETIQKELRDKLEEAERFKAKMKGGVKMGSLEDLLICVMISASFAKIEDAYSLSIRKFRKILDRADAKLSYQIYTILSGTVDFKDKSILKHWMADLSKKKYSDVMVSTEEMVSKGLKQI